ncbi:MAG TPA: patatin-like phospholipase family protein, partial [Longimicrobium sp.]|nr:patatin-like phospholipase family protein [Longimicrobium sp.]
MSDLPASPAPTPPASSSSPDPGQPPEGPGSPAAAAPGPAAARAPFDPGRPLGNLALSLSGGGYRAAAFHLGTLRLIERVGLLPGVMGLSTVSGGTIFGMAWAVSMIDGKSFDEFDDAFSKYLLGTNVIGEALHGLRAGRASGEWASLIRAAADVYARPNFLGDRRLGEVLAAPGLQLQEVIFNTTEFHRGLDFRFRRSKDAEAIIGNWFLRVPPSVAQNVRLADVTAASSCFPGGFEPIVFPQQFDWSPQYPLDAALKALPADFHGGLPLMDGGVYDNQGVESLEYAFDKQPDVTFVVCDVSARNTSMFDVPPDPGSRGFLTLRGVWRLALLMALLALASAGVLFWKGLETARAGDWGWDDYLLYLVPGLLAAGVGIGLWWARRSLAQANRLVTGTVDTDVWPSLEKLTVPEFMQMVTLRVTSLLSLTTTVFMARIRRLVFNRVWEDKRYKNRRIANLIYAMARDEPELFDKHPWLRPGPAMVDLAQTAERMGTTLWFNEPAEFTTVRDAGEHTICFVLLRHIVRDRPGEYETPGTPLHDLYQRLRKEWDRC